MGQDLTDFILQSGYVFSLSFLGIHGGGISAPINALIGRSLVFGKTLAHSFSSASAWAVIPSVCMVWGQTPKDNDDINVAMGMKQNFANEVLSC